MQKEETWFGEGKRLEGEWGCSGPLPGSKPSGFLWWWPVAFGLAALWLTASARATDASSLAEETRGDVCDPVLELRTSGGHVAVQLHADAAPQTVARIVELTRSGLFELVAGEGESILSASNTYFAGLEFAEIRPQREVVTSWRDHDGLFEVPTELSAEPFGLHEQRIETVGEAMDALQYELLPVWGKKRGASSPRLQEWARQYHETNDASFLLGTTQQEMQEALGVTYVDGLPSVPHRRGSVSLVDAGGGSARLQLSFELRDYPRRNGRTVVVGSLIEGLDLLDAVALQPRLVAFTGDKHHRARPVDPLRIEGSLIRTTTKGCAAPGTAVP